MPEPSRIRRAPAFNDTRPATSARFANSIVRRLHKAPPLRPEDRQAIAAALNAVEDIRLGRAS